MVDGAYVRLNANMVKNTAMGDGQIISIVGSMQAADGETITLTTSDGQPLTYRISSDIDFVKVCACVDFCGACVDFCDSF